MTICRQRTLKTLKQKCTVYVDQNNPIRTDYRHLFKSTINDTIVTVQVYNHVALCFAGLVDLL
jgi:hypothetical protein